jgi:endonuclease YncB( thermonuclease family)
MRLTAAAGLFLALAACAQTTTHESFEPRVVGVLDGDTIDVRAGNAPPYRIRLAGIDAPEKGQAFGDNSKKNLSDWVFQKVVRIEWDKKDRYGRILGKVFVTRPDVCAKAPCPETFDVNLAQISSGYAWHYKQYENEQSKTDRQMYEKAEQDARKQKLGLWRDAYPIPPWEWRHGPSKSIPETPGEGPVRKSRNNICHDPSMSTYSSVQHFTSFQTLEECIASGGRLPKKPGG